MVDLEQFDDDAMPKGRADASDLPDGDYEFEIEKAIVKTSKEKKKVILSMDLLVVKGHKEGSSVEKPYFLSSQDAVNICLDEFVRLGFDCENWKKANGRPMSQELEKATYWLTDVAKAAKAEGKPAIRFRASKKKNGEYHNINIKERLADGHPAKIGEAELATVQLNPF